ncbi:TetR/AcrR family transcriptional regulator [Nocardia sp. NBC_01503]|uniref:TetR/AcrR family transcriptional regulator n=1 Tax=Nocardia sp. NBC_01503 TaxID=2975997 RepID=UPI002E7BB112|nr:helix-turn-helix domain-containing protein [Nocardia sp. NBC_01503]WTL36089.1 TetR/AcrR family transcriptional regulator [Nocardia sp. NBC_01503]
MGTPGVGPALPVIDSEPAERADAARNRKLLLDAAAELVRIGGADALTMDALAKQAGVGKGTVFRRFGNRAGLMYALLDESDRNLQAAYMFGPPPLGPGAPALERLVAYGRARLSYTEIMGDVMRAATDNSRRYDGAPYNVSKAHVSILLRDSGIQGETALLADTLLAPLEAALVLHQIRRLGFTVDQIGDNWEALVRRIVPAPATRHSDGDRAVQ